MKGGLLVVGAGAAGYFAAIKAREENPSRQVVMIESGAKPLRKVAISGGGRCNVTHACFEPNELIRAYPRGAQELRGPFSRFQPRDTVRWFEERGVKLKTEDDGRIFPESDLSQSIIDCLEQAREAACVELRLKTKLSQFERIDGPGISFLATLKTEKEKQREEFAALVLATGSSPGGYELAKALGHEIRPCVPSLFTFKLSDPRLAGLAGVSVPQAEIQLFLDGKKTLRETGPVLITHWGLSGPGVIKLSAWAAKELAAQDYQAEIQMNWTPQYTPEEISSMLRSYKSLHPKRNVLANAPFPFPKRLWTTLAHSVEIANEEEWGELRKEALVHLAEEIQRGKFSVIGKGEFKDEFVTCGGVALREVDFRTMESKVQPQVFFAGEILDIDGVTGGYNFQSAWTTGWIAGMAAAGLATDTGSILD